jgi:transcriptional regulator with XRE-family HTH domain
MRSTAPQDRSPIGKRVQDRRRQLGLTPAELGERLGCSAGRVYNIECYGVGTLDLVEQLARALDEDPRWIAFGSYRDDELREHARQRGLDAARTLDRLGA